MTNAPQRNHVAVGITRLQVQDIVRFQTKVRLGLHIDLIAAPEPIELIHVQRTQIHLHGVEQLLQVHALGNRLVAIHVGIDLRHVLLEAGEQPGQHRVGVAGGNGRYAHAAHQSVSGAAGPDPITEQNTARPTKGQWRSAGGKTSTSPENRPARA